MRMSDSKSVQTPLTSRPGAGSCDENRRAALRRALADSDSVQRPGAESRGPPSSALPRVNDSDTAHTGT